MLRAGPIADDATDPSFAPWSMEDIIKCQGEILARTVWGPIDPKWYGAMVVFWKD